MAMREWDGSGSGGGGVREGVGGNVCVLKVQLWEFNPCSSDWILPARLACHSSCPSAVDSLSSQYPMGISSSWLLVKPLSILLCHCTNHGKQKLTLSTPATPYKQTPSAHVSVVPTTSDPPMPSLTPWAPRWYDHQAAVHKFALFPWFSQCNEYNLGLL